MAVAPILVLAPAQMVAAEPTAALGSGLTVIFTESVLVQPVAVMVSVSL